MQHPEEGTIHAWLDGALSPEESAAIEAHVAECPECAAVAAEARGLIAASSRIVSALDVIPSGVIPARPSRAGAWYMSTQFRAAAAVLIVAGATMLVARSRPGKTVSERAIAPQHSVTAIASAPATAPAESPAATTVAVPMIAQRKSSSAAKEKAPSPLREMKAQSAAGVRADERALAVIPQKPRVDSVSSKSLAESDFSGAVTANAPAIELKQLRSDTTASVVTTVYEVSPGVEVTLTEKTRLPVLLSAPSAARRATAQNAAPVPPPVAAASADAAEKANAIVSSITWTDKLGRVQTLSGRVSKDELESIRKLLTPDKR